MRKKPFLQDPIGHPYGPAKGHENTSQIGNENGFSGDLPIPPKPPGEVPPSHTPEYFGLRPRSHNQVN